jgi:hypothetical protein
MIMNRYAFCCFGLALAIIAGLSSAADVTRRDTAPPKQRGALVPAFSPAQDGPTFHLAYTNDSAETADITDLLQTSSIVLDGKTYPRQTVKFCGNANLSPGQTWTSTFTVSGYLPVNLAQRQGYSKTLKRWRWKTPLESGRHTVLVKLGGKEYGPVTFTWDADTPLLYD